MRCINYSRETNFVVGWTTFLFLLVFGTFVCIPDRNDIVTEETLPARSGPYYIGTDGIIYLTTIGEIMKVKGGAVIQFTKAELLALHNWLCYTEEARSASVQLDVTEKNFLRRFYELLKSYLD